MARGALHKTFGAPWRLAQHWHDLGRERAVAPGNARSRDFHVRSTKVAPQGQRWGTDCVASAREMEGDKRWQKQHCSRELWGETFCHQCWCLGWEVVVAALSGGPGPSALAFPQCTPSTSLFMSPVLRRAAGLRSLAEEQLWWKVASKASTMAHSNSSKVCEMSLRKVWEEVGTW